LLILPILMPAPDEVARLAVPREQGIGRLPATRGLRATIHPLHASAQADRREDNRAEWIGAIPSNQL